MIDIIGKYFVFTIALVLLSRVAAAADDEQIVDFAAEEQAQAKESAAIKNAALGQVSGEVIDRGNAPQATAEQADSEQEVDFGVEEQAAAAESAAIKNAALAASAGTLTKTDDGQDSEEEVDFGAEEKAADAESAAIQAAAAPGHGHGLAVAAQDVVDAKGKKLSPEQKARRQKELEFWRAQPFPEHQYQPWLTLAPALGLLLLLWNMPWKNKKVNKIKKAR